jgi:uncharacterized membrane protein
MITGLARGAEAFLAFVLLLAGLAKLSDPSSTRQSMTRLLPARFRDSSTGPLTAAAVTLGTAEVLGGVALIVRPLKFASAVDLIVTTLCVGFIAVVGVARHRGAACGCFGSFSAGISGPVESARAAALALIAGTTTVMRVEGSGAARPYAVATGAAVSLAITVGATWRRDRLVRPIRILRVAVAGSDVPRFTDGWRRARPWERHRVLKVLRRHPAVTEVVDRTSWITWSWRHAQVSLTTQHGRTASVVVPGKSARLHVLAPDPGHPAVVGYTAKGVIVPKSR